MKKILTILGGIGFSALSATPVVSCQLHHKDKTNGDFLNSSGSKTGNVKDGGGVPPGCEGWYPKCWDKCRKDK